MGRLNLWSKLFGQSTKAQSPQVTQKTSAPNAMRASAPIADCVAAELVAEVAADCATTGATVPMELTVAVPILPELAAWKAALVVPAAVKIADALTDAPAPSKGKPVGVTPLARSVLTWVTLDAILAAAPAKEVPTDVSVVVDS